MPRTPVSLGNRSPYHTPTATSSHLHFCPQSYRPPHARLPQRRLTSESAPIPLTSVPSSRAYRPPSRSGHITSTILLCLFRRAVPSVRVFLRSSLRSCSPFVTVVRHAATATTSTLRDVLHRVFLSEHGALTADPPVRLEHVPTRRDPRGVRRGWTWTPDGDSDFTRSAGIPATTADRGSDARHDEWGPARSYLWYSLPEARHHQIWRKQAVQVGRTRKHVRRTRGQGPARGAWVATRGRAHGGVVELDAFAQADTVVEYGQPVVARGRTTEGSEGSEEGEEVGGEDGERGGEAEARTGGEVASGTGEGGHGEAKPGDHAEPHEAAARVEVAALRQPPQPGRRTSATTGGSETQDGVVVWIGRTTAIAGFFQPRSVVVRLESRRADGKGEEAGVRRRSFDVFLRRSEHRSRLDDFLCYYRQRSWSFTAGSQAKHARAESGDDGVFDGFRRFPGFSEVIELVIARAAAGERFPDARVGGSWGIVIGRGFAAYARAVVIAFTFVADRSSVAESHHGPSTADEVNDTATRRSSSTAVQRTRTWAYTKPCTGRTEVGDQSHLQSGESSMKMVAVVDVTDSRA